MDIKSTLYYSQESQFESQIRKTLKESYRNEKPSRKALNAIICFAASYDCVDTKIGKVEMIFN
ncbi:MAG: hypothetical protein IJZ87_03555 [Bacteroidales bacterium]|nr:hypothetical protein [Bacteroidales bacterium]